MLESCQSVLVGIKQNFKSSADVDYLLENFPNDILEHKLPSI
jgi:hypothetical protein